MPECLRRAVASLLILAVPTLAASCTAAPACPTDVDQAISGAFPAIGQTPYVAVGRLARYVDSSDAQTRGYDLDVRRTLSGATSGQGTFLRLADPVPGMKSGQAVLIIGQRGPDERTVLAGACPPLLPITDAELTRWTGSR